MFVERIYELCNPSASLEDVSILLLKPGFDPNTATELEERVSSARLQVELKSKLTLPALAVVALYGHTTLQPHISDAVYGLEWRNRMLDYMTSGESRAYLVAGNQAATKAREIRDVMRASHGKVTIPTRTYSGNEFFNLVIKNVVHNPDKSELLPTAWALDRVEN
jgi:hypothetical protein